MTDSFTVLDCATITKIFERFKLGNPDPKSELIAPNDFCLLVSVMLSAQATDKSVNKATKELYTVADTPQKITALGEDGLIPYIKSIGLYRNKAKNIIAASSIITQKYGGKLPCTREALMELPGVGRKTANVILNAVFNQPVMPVDTHLLRVSPRIGLSKGTTPEQVEEDLVRVIPAEYMLHAHHWLLLHGRYICTARSPDCENCLIRDLCAHNI